MNWLINLIGLDKLKHIGITFIISSFIGTIIFLLSNIECGIISAVYSGLVVGLTKEFFDSYFDWKDLLADIVGIILSIIWLILITLG